MLFFYALEEIITKTKRSLFGIDKFMKQLLKGGKFNVIVLGKIIPNYMFTYEVGFPHDVLLV